MVSTRRKHYNPPKPDNFDPHIFRTLIAGSAPQSLNPALLKSLYRLLVYLSLKTPSCCSNYEVASESSNVKFHKFGFNLEFKDIRYISDILFKELDEKFKQVLSAIHDNSANQASGQSALYLDIFDSAQEHTLLLRCCLVILNLLAYDQNLLFERCKVLFSILGRLCSLDLTGGMETSFKKSVSRDCTYIDNGCTTSVAEDIVASLRFIASSDSRLPFVCAILEVFANELLSHRPLREYFFMVNSVSSTSEMVFICHSSHCDMASVIEVIAAHFLTSFSNELAFVNFLSKLFWEHDKDCRIPELNLTAGVPLLINPIMLSAPKLLQAHVISLVSKIITINMDPGSIRPYNRQVDCYLSAFEKSVILYARIVSSMEINGLPIGAHSSALEPHLSGRSFVHSFESYIQPVTRSKIKHLVTKLESSWHSCFCNMFVRTKADLVSASIAYIKESQDVLDESCRDEILSILQVIILRASDEDSNTLLHTKGETSLPDLCLLASLLKLISCSLLQALWCARHSGDLGSRRSLKDLSSSCREYAFIVSVISSCFGQFSVHLPIQRFLCDVMESHPMRHMESKLMLFHFSGLLSLSFACGLDVLLKGCIYMIMSLMNLFIFEEGNVNALRSLLGSESKTVSSQKNSENVPEVLKNKKSSQTVASKFQNIQKMYLSSDLLANDCPSNKDVRAKSVANDVTLTNMKESVVGIIEENEETCSGNIFLKCRLEDQHKSSDIDDLADFIVCKPGKDYAGWLKNRQRYRKSKSEKLAVLSWQKWRKTWRMKKGKRT